MFEEATMFVVPGMLWREERRYEPEPLRSLPQSDVEDDGAPDLNLPSLAPKFEIEPT